MNNKNTTAILKNIVSNVEKVIIGKRDAVENVLISLLCKGHVLIEDVPGVGKTSMVSSLARSINCSFRRIQFTPDIMPSDITGFSMYNQKTGEFEYKQGAIMSQFILADEINRTSPKTQSSLLEAMEENQVTVDGITHKIPLPFMVLATQNPVEYLGTYPLPEAQLDRFFMKVTIGYPNESDENRIVARFKNENPLVSLTPAAEADEILYIQEQVGSIHIGNPVSEYIVSIVRATRELESVVLGASPRASICLYRAAQAWALYQGRDYVIPDDVIKMSGNVLEHRIIMKQEAKLKKITPASAIQNCLNSIKVPVL